MMKCETIPDLEKFLQIQEQALGSGAPEVAETASKLGELYLKEGKLDMAESLFRRALTIREKLVGPHHGEIQESKETLEKLALMKLKNSPGNPSRGESKSSTGGRSIPAQFEATISSTCIQPLKRVSVPGINEAINDCKMEADLLKQMVGPQHPSVADILTKLADLYCRLRMYSEMEPLLIESLKIREAACGSNHLSVSTELKNLAHLYMAQERLYLAEPLLKRAILIREKSFGKMHPRVADVQESYIALLRKTNRNVQALAIEQHVNEIRRNQSTESMTSGRSTIFGTIW